MPGEMSAYRLRSPTRSQCICPVRTSTTSPAVDAEPGRVEARVEVGAGDRVGLVEPLDALEPGDVAEQAAGDDGPKCSMPSFVAPPSIEIASAGTPL